MPHTKCVAAAKEKAKHAQAEEEQRKKAEEEVSSRPLADGVSLLFVFHSISSTG